MSINLHLLKGSGCLDPFLDQIQTEFNNFNQKIKDIFPPQNIDIVVYDNQFGVIPEIGIGGFTPYSYLIFISLDPTFPNLKKSITGQFSRTLAHEIHHAIRSKYVGYGNTLLEALITEGLADHFDLEINQTKPQIWDIALNKKQIENFKKLATKEFFNKKYYHNNWFFGSKNIPKWTGYTLGFNLVADYLKKHPNQKPSTLFDTKAEEFI
jgi:uncharacterized protein YjaZ